MRRTAVGERVMDWLMWGDCELKMDLCVGLWAVVVCVWLVMR